MNPLIQEKLLDLLINIISIVLGGGVVVMIIELRRHRRESRAWAREDNMVEIDVPRADVMVRKWQVSEKMTPEEKVVIYENQLEGTVKHLVAVAHFVIRNTTAAEIIVTSYDANLLQIPPGDDRKCFYEWETFDLISVEDMGAIKLRPYAAIARVALIESHFDQERKLNTVPSTLVVEAWTSSGAIIHGSATLSVVPRLADIEFYRGRLHTTKYVDKIRPEPEPEEGEIPF